MVASPTCSTQSRPADKRGEANLEETSRERRATRGAQLLGFSSMFPKKKPERPRHSTEKTREPVLGGHKDAEKNER